MPSSSDVRCNASITSVSSVSIGSYVPYTDIQDSDEYDFDVHDRREASEMMHETEDKSHEGKVLTGRFFVEEGRHPYQQEKTATGEIPEDSLAERYSDDDYDWECNYGLLDIHR